MIEADDLALLTASFAAAMRAAPGAGAADVVLHDLGWADLLSVAPMQGAAAAFSALGTTGSAACLLDDVVVGALGLPVSTATCIVLPAPHRTGMALTGRTIDGIVSARVDSATRVIVPRDVNGVVHVGWASADLVRVDIAVGLDSARPYQRAVADDVDVNDLQPVAASWSDVVAQARAALAHQLIAASRGMLEQARQHAIDRVQFGRPIASFQAIRHKLADCLVAIEGAAAVADLCSAGTARTVGTVGTAGTGIADPLFAAVAKSLAGKAARLTATHAQQVLAGIGFTTDHQFHLSLKRTMVLDTLFGSARTLPTEIGQLLLAKRGVPRIIEL